MHKELPTHPDLYPLEPDGKAVTRGAKVPKLPDVSISILVLDTAEPALHCLESIHQHAAPDGSYEVIILANGTPESELARLEARDDIILIRSAVNHGFGGGHNWTARFARGRYLVLLNDDVEVQSGWLKGLLRASEETPEAGAVGSRVLDPDGMLQEAGGIIWANGETTMVGQGLPPSSIAYGERRTVDYCSFCSVLITREAWDAVGGFDERYFPAYYEDIDLCVALWTAGFTVLYEPSSRVLHDRGKSSSATFRSYLAKRNQRQFVTKRREWLAHRDARPAGLPSAPTPNQIAFVVDRTALQLPVSLSQGRPTCSAQRRVVSPTDVEAIELRHLHADAAVKQAYINEIERRLHRFEMPSRSLSAALESLDRFPELRRVAAIVKRPIMRFVDRVVVSGE